jgi:hypothetical protein
LLDTSQSNKTDFIYFNYYKIDKTRINLLNDFFNIPYVYQGMIECLRNLEIGGTAILYLGSVIHKPIADIHLIVAKYFKSAELYQPEIYSNLKRDGVYGIYQSYKGINDKELDDHIKVKRKIEKLYPNGHEDFNVKDKEIRELLDITKDVSIMPSKYITGFLDNDLSEPIYNDIKMFNTRKTLDRYIELNKLIAYSNEEITDIKLPTKDQIISSLMYCRKWGIEYYDTFDKNIFKSAYARGILDEIYGLHEPLIYKFKTVNKLYFVKKHTLKLNSGKISSIRFTRKSSSSLNSSKYKSKSGRIKLDDNLLNILEDTKLQDASTTLSSSNLLPFSSRSKFISLLEELEPVNNNIDGATKLIDTRRDFTKPIEQQNILWHKINVLFLQYKHKDNLEREHLDTKVSRILRDYTITQAWLKMYEMIVECNLVRSAGRDGIFRTFHLCELPGGFISAINNYVFSKTKFRGFEWVGQSLNPGTAKIGDQKGIFKRHKDNWSFGADGSGDITKLSNIKYYKKYTNNVNLITSDCGLDMKTPGLSKVEYSSLVAILYLLPIGGDFVYKILTPITDGFLLNLIYICYHNFNDLIFFKPVQNAHSREYYIVGKGYRGTDINIMDKLLKNVENFDEKMDLFEDKYPEEFVRQFVKGYDILARSCISMYKKHVFYLVHYDELPKEFLELVENYYKEKNMDWVRKYDIKQIPENKKL